MLRQFSWQWIVILCAGLAGCGGTELYDAEAPPVTITGRVFYRGTPLSNGWIVFSADPDFGAGTDTMMIPIAGDGTFQAYDGKQWGLKAGYYRIAVSTHNNTGWQLPSRYRDPSTSGLKCMIEANQPLRIRLELD